MLQIKNSYSLSTFDMSCRHSHNNNVCKHNECSFNCVQRETLAIRDCVGSIVPEYARNEECFATVLLLDIHKCMFVGLYI